MKSVHLRLLTMELSSNMRTAEEIENFALLSGNSS